MSIDRSTEQQIINFTRGTPALPDTAEFLFPGGKICNISPAKLYKIIVLDPVLFCHIQSFYAYYRPENADGSHFNSIAKIIITLNANTIRSVVAYRASKAHTMLKAPGTSKEIIERQQKLCIHSFACAIVARNLAKARGIDESDFELYYAAGLVHDIGKYFFLDQEDHCELGLIMAKAMSLPKSLQSAIEHHHNLQYKGENSDIVHNTIAADYFLNNHLSQHVLENEIRKLPGQFWRDFGFTLDKLCALEPQIRADIRIAENLLKAGG